ncbi:MAG: electron transfer flavoprotein subunit beta/FixA family protein [Gammaproteobacteria bacterium]|nr:electron transfer flavoprotein subunit beta/FixA family protein [Gammaproteobacteria bacterium]
MKVLVCVKRVVDYNVRIRVKPDGGGVVTDGVKMAMNPFDEIAVEEALRMREAGHVSEVVAVTIGDKKSQEQLRTALAMGADRAIWVEHEEAIQPLGVARVLKALAEREQPGLVLLGKQAIDDDCGQTAQMLAALWQRPQATYASEVVISGETVRVTREVDAGLEVIDVDLPAVISTDLRLNEPRYVKLPDIMKAKRKPMDSYTLPDLGVELPPLVERLETTPPPARTGGFKVESVEELVATLKEKGLV